jgi:hypothetical protein
VIEVSGKGKKLRTRTFATCLLLIILALSFTSIMPIQGVEEGEWITEYTIRDSNGKLLKEVNFETGVNETYSQILAGTELAVTFTVNIFAGGAGNLRLSTNMQHSSLHTTFFR